MLLCKINTLNPSIRKYAKRFLFTITVSTLFNKRLLICEDINRSLSIAMRLICVQMQVYTGIIASPLEVYTIIKTIPLRTCS